MPMTGFLKIPDIPGESVRADHEDEIDIHSIDWGVSRQQSAATGSGRSRSRADVRSVSLGKFYDASSPYLALACMQGKSFDEIVISLRKDSGDAHLDYLRITLSNVVISGYDVNTPPEGSQLADTVRLSFEKINILYIVQADDHSAGDEHEIEFDVFAGV